jgi:chloramphenicol-sensitive protein RarD
MKNGIFAAIGAYILWGLLPIYWKTIDEVPAIEILCHRMVWSLVFVVLILSWKKHWRWLKAATKNRSTLFTFLVSAVILALNWLTYIWAINSGYIVEASLGYFINPLISVVLGVLFLKERLRLWQWLSISLALTGVSYLTFSYGKFPWIALILAFSFGFYGLLRKTSALSSLEGLSVELAIMFLPALAYLLYLESSGTASFGHTAATTSGILALTGVATATPLLFFAYGARRVQLSTLGILQYIAPSIQFLLGVFVYKEDFPQTRLVGFIIIWISLFIYTFESFVQVKRKRECKTSVTVRYFLDI